ncbi:MAG: hypothetical protein ACP5G1_03960 [Nanopusillaceae archaeon]
MSVFDETKKFKFEDCKDKQCFKKGIEMLNIEIDEHYNGMFEELIENMTDDIMNLLSKVIDHLFDEGYKFYIRLLRDPCSDEILVDFVVYPEDKSYDWFKSVVLKLYDDLKRISEGKINTYFIGFDVKI